IRLRQHDTALRGVAQSNRSQLAKLPHPLEVAEKIDRVGFASRKSRENRRPNLSGILSSNRLAVLGFDQLESDRFYFAAEVQRLYIQGEGWQFQSTASRRGRSRRAHSSDSNCGNFARKSGACLRTSSQSKKASGVSSQMRNQPAISSFPTPFSASSLWLHAFLSARRLPGRATFQTRSPATFSPCPRTL